MLVTIDGSENSKKAAEYAISLAKKYKAEKLANTKISVTDRIIVSVSSIVGEIIGFADKEKVDLIILGTRGRTGFKKL
ncbi:MAG: universal stress protein [Nitrosopumilales archaeon]|nr:MAG: universal stress protein [Nitrosopumilales archaeon]